jgi:hypothetical protein
VDEWAELAEGGDAGDARVEADGATAVAVIPVIDVEPAGREQAPRRASVVARTAWTPGTA